MANDESNKLLRILNLYTWVLDSFSSFFFLYNGCSLQINLLNSSRVSICYSHLLSPFHHFCLYFSLIILKLLFIFLFLNYSNILINYWWPLDFFYFERDQIQEKNADPKPLDLSHEQISPRVAFWLGNMKQAKLDTRRSSENSVRWCERE